MTYPTNEHLELLQALDNHVRWLKEGYNDQDKDANLEFDTLFEFHIRKLEGLIGDLADYFGAKKKYVQREPDTQENKNSLGMYPGVPVAEREKIMLRKKYGDVFDQDTIGHVDERWK